MSIDGAVTFRFSDGSELPLYRANVSEVENDRLSRLVIAKGKQLKSMGLSTQGKVLAQKRRIRESVNLAS